MYHLFEFYKMMNYMEKESVHMNYVMFEYYSLDMCVLYILGEASRTIILPVFF